ncbi:uncharacterized protein P884DRAFT_236984 [Thermothelomyces heterothallicus CBS 202.75]|uniref:uncharacterized protein n=1 Tax=Thermothelomyces heterothallicus CBS 202.75 TaxID=1149848 RepID=UPI0037447E18
MDLRSRCQQPRSGVADPISSPRYRVSEVLEIAICSLCSVAMWEYTVQNEMMEKRDGVSGPHNGAEDAAGPSVFRPSPGLMLFSCLVFGCCVSSFTYRRQDQDPFQFVIYLILLGCVAMIGYAVGARLHLILLGYLPWATCAAMAISISGHSVYKYLKTNPTGPGQDEEKARLWG